MKEWPYALIGISLFQMVTYTGRILDGEQVKNSSWVYASAWISVGLAVIIYRYIKDRNNK